MTRISKHMILIIMFLFTSINQAQSKPSVGERGKVIAPSSLKFINTSFENASPLFWTIGEDGKVNIELMYDHERNALNRAVSHWYFQVFAEAGSDLVLVLENLYNIWNGRIDLSDATDQTISFISEDGKKWEAIETEYLKEEHKLELKIHMQSDSLYIARVEPYTISDLEELKNEITDHPLIKISQIGRTFEGRPLEIIRIGHSNAKYRIFIRARSHSWEAGGNWVVQGLIRSLIKGNYISNKYLDRYAVYIMPMANKDQVAHGGTRFTVGGVNLNRKWNKPADSVYNPENAALEAWFEKMIAQGLKPDLAIDFHNDANGNLHFSHPPVNLERYIKNMKRFEELLFKYTWFREGAIGASFSNPGTFGEGLVARYNIDAMIYELNANWIKGLSKYPYGEDWELLGKQLRDVFYDYFNEE